LSADFAYSDRDLEAREEAETVTLPGQQNRGPFVGREEEFERLGAALDGPGLVTIVGPGGVGKTRLALEFVEESEEVVAVWLDELRSDEEIPARVAAALDLQPMGKGDVARIAEALQGRGELVLLLDNAEHVVDGVRQLVTELPLTRVRVLVTSRVALELPAERRIRLQSLPPDDARALLEERGAMLDVDASGAPEELLEALDRLPLAIELAAARMTILTPEQILARLGESNAVLGSNDPSRHGALDRAIAWSWEHLEDDERRFLVPLAEFDHPLASEFVEALWPNLDVWQIAGSLESKSWLQVVAVGDEKRWGTLRAIRRFLVGTLDEGHREQFQHRLADWAREHVGELSGWWASYVPEALRAVEVLAEAEEHATAARVCVGTFFGAFGGPHFKACLRTAEQILERWSGADDPRVWSTLAAQVAKGAFRLDVGVDPLRWSQRAYDHAPADTGARLRAGAQHVLCLLDAARRDQANTVLEDLVASGEAFPEEMAVASPLLDLATAAHEMGRFEVARSTCEKVLRIARRADNKDAQARAWIHMSYVSYDEGDFDRAAVEISQLERLMDDRHPHERLAVGGAVGALVALQMGRDDEARESLEERLEVAREIEYHGMLFFLHLAGAEWAVRNAPGDVGDHLEEALVLASRVGSRKSTAHARFRIALEQIRRGEYEDAREVLARLRDGRPPASPGHWNDVLDACLWFCAVRLGDDLPAAEGPYGELMAAVVASAHGLDRAPMEEVLSAYDASTWSVPGLYFMRIDDVARRWYENLVRDSGTKRLRLRRDGRKMQFVGEPAQDLTRRGPLRRILLRLVEHQQSEPTEALSAEEVIDAGWPDEKILHDAALTRVYTTMNRLRTIGFEPWLQTLDSGYALDTRLVVEWVDDVG
jgi:tetratricopeptide (TPR) repeat protein